MKTTLGVLGAAAGAIVLTLTTVVVTLLSLMFSTGEESVRKVGLFGSLFFETTEQAGGATGVSMGVEHLGVLGGVFAFYLAVLVLAVLLHRQWRLRRRHPLAQGA
ncbi:hypothetical protein [uncultured Friedmanniella sp.]|uniref:hypothetical protein n=1 Tax=uncultured Friedmanniella sp. TaxID=335381 RepID=UPI0035C9A0C3